MYLAVKWKSQIIEAIYNQRLITVIKPHDFYTSYTSLLIVTIKDTVMSVMHTTIEMPLKRKKIIWNYFRNAWQFYSKIEKKNLLKEFLTGPDEFKLLCCIAVLLQTWIMCYTHWKNNWSPRREKEGNYLFEISWHHYLAGQLSMLVSGYYFR